MVLHKNVGEYVVALIYFKTLTMYNGRGFLFSILSNVLSFNIRIAFVLPLIVGLCLATVNGFSQNGKFHIDSLFPSNVSDTLTLNNSHSRIGFMEKKGSTC